jgi:hypothetical protein
MFPDTPSAVLAPLVTLHVEAEPSRTGIANDSVTPLALSVTFPVRVSVLLPPIENPLPPALNTRPEIESELKSSVSDVPDAPAAPNTKLSPLCGGALPPVQSVLFQFVNVAPTQVSVAAIVVCAEQITDAAAAEIAAHRLVD